MSLSDAKRATVQDKNYVTVDPSQADSRAQGYYVELTPYNYTDLRRLTGSDGIPSPTPANSPVVPTAGYTHDSVLASARSAAAANTRYDTVSEKGVQLEVPEDSRFLTTPFPMKANAQKNGLAIYIIPKPEPQNGTLGTVAHGETVTILAETEYYYFFVTADGRAGWNGKSFFADP